MGPRTGLDAVNKRQILYIRESNPGCPARSPSLYRPSYSVSQPVCSLVNKVVSELFAT
jgi:hypothetical protein